MPSYVALMQWTDQGVRSLPTWGQRVSAAEDLIKRNGGQLKETYVTLGQYDVVAIVDAPDDETAAQIVMAIGSQGNVRTQTLRAFTRNEAQRLIEKALT
ncbi:MAG: GYD domain-containing protein [Acidobacteria bacterium]|nr:GYD domain-containing protein [Acidobacteriota bacterium]